MPHPMGDIKVNLKENKDKRLTGNVILPVGLSGTFEWGGKMIALAQGDNTFNNQLAQNNGQYNRQCKYA